MWWDNFDNKIKDLISKQSKCDDLNICYHLNILSSSHHSKVDKEWKWNVMESFVSSRSINTSLMNETIKSFIIPNFDWWLKWFKYCNRALMISQFMIPIQVLLLSHSWLDHCIVFIHMMQDRHVVGQTQDLSLNVQ